MSESCQTANTVIITILIKNYSGPNIFDSFEVNKDVVTPTLQVLPV